MTSGTGRPSGDRHVTPGLLIRVPQRRRRTGSGASSAVPRPAHVGPARATRSRNRPTATLFPVFHMPCCALRHRSVAGQRILLVPNGVHEPPLQRRIANSCWLRFRNRHIAVTNDEPNTSCNDTPSTANASDPTRCRRGSVRWSRVASANRTRHLRDHARLLRSKCRSYLRDDTCVSRYGPSSFTHASKTA